jgi:hypothetical protein
VPLTSPQKGVEKRPQKTAFSGAQEHLAKPSTKDPFCGVVSGMDLTLDYDSVFLPAGLELDALIAVHLLRWQHITEAPPRKEPVAAPFAKIKGSAGPWFLPPGWEFPGSRPGLYSTDIGYAWPLLKHFDKFMVESNLRGGITAMVRLHNYSNWGQADGDTAELAICRAIILALIAEETKAPVEPLILGR